MKFGHSGVSSEITSRMTTVNINAPLKLNSITEISEFQLYLFSTVLFVTLKTHSEKNRVTGLVPAKSTGTGPDPVPAQIPPEPELRSGPIWNYLLLGYMLILLGYLVTWLPGLTILLGYLGLKKTGTCLSKATIIYLHFSCQSSLTTHDYIWGTCLTWAGNITLGTGALWGHLGHLDHFGHFYFLNHLERQYLTWHLIIVIRPKQTGPYFRSSIF